MFLLPLLAAQAAAATYYVTLCAEYNVSYDDADSFGDDYVSASGSYPARGARITVTRNSDGVVMHDSYALYTGANAGCLPASLALDSTKTYNLKMWSKASVNGNLLYVYSDDTAFGIYGYGPATYSPTSTGTYTVTSPNVAQWKIANSVGHAMWRRWAGLTGESYTFFNEPSSGGGSAYDRVNDRVYLSSGGVNTKYMTVHEFGHMLAARANDSGTCATDSCAADKDYGADPGACYTDATENHEAHSKEFASAAVWEGIAHYYAVVAFNRTDQTDCTWVYYKDIDWDLNTIVDPFTNEEKEPFAVSCESYPALAPNPDYLGNYCSGGNNRSTEYDWLRHFWDLDTDGGVSNSDLYELWDLANSDTWSASGNGSDTDDSTPCSPTPSYPAGRLRCAAQQIGKLTEWDAWDSWNGVQR